MKDLVEKLPTNTLWSYRASILAKVFEAGKEFGDEGICTLGVAPIKLQIFEFRLCIICSFRKEVFTLIDVDEEEVIISTGSIFINVGVRGSALGSLNKGMLEEFVFMEILGVLFLIIIGGDHQRWFHDGSDISQRQHGGES